MGLREKELEKEKEYLEFLREKEEIDKILIKIQNDKEVKLKKEFLKREETKKFIASYLIKREQFRANQLKAEKEENAKIAEWSKMEEKQKEMDFMQDLINELSMEENQLKILEKERKEFEKKQRLKEEMK